MNKLVSFKEAAKSMLDALDGVPPKPLAAFVYSFQTSAGFPRDPKEEARISALPDDDEALKAWLAKQDELRANL